MEIITWDDKFKIGVEVVDKAHEKLFRIMKKLIETRVCHFIMPKINDKARFCMGLRPVFCINFL